MFQFYSICQCHHVISCIDQYPCLVYSYNLPVSVARLSKLLERPIDILVLFMKLFPPKHYMYFFILRCIKKSFGLYDCWLIILTYTPNTLEVLKPFLFCQGRSFLEQSLKRFMSYVPSLSYLPLKKGCFRVFLIIYNMITRRHTDMGPTVTRPSKWVQGPTSRLFFTFPWIRYCSNTNFGNFMLGFQYPWQ